MHVLDRVVKALTYYVVFRDERQADACTLWIAHTYAIGCFDTTPYLHITSPEKRSGKTRLFEVLELLVHMPWRQAQPSEAVVFRKIERDHPTLMLDEVDAVFGKNAKHHEGLRGILNAGHRRGTSVSRCVGEGTKMELKDFDVFCAKAIAGIGNLPDTVADRCIRIEMARKAPTEQVVRFRVKVAEEATAPLRESLREWVAEVEPSLKDAEPPIPTELDDRSADGWEPLLAIADAAGGNWPVRAREAAIALSCAKVEGDESYQSRLLAHVRDCFEDAERMSSDSLLRRLVQIEDAPYGEWWGKALDFGDTRGPGFRLSKALRPFGIKPRDIRIEGSVLKGYHRDDFEDAWTRYLDSPPETTTSTQQRDTAGEDDDEALIAAWSDPS